jgi:hypothetical protein
MDENKIGAKDKAQKKSAKKEEVSSKITNWLYLLIFISNLMLNVDHGVIPAAIKDLKEHYDYGNLEIGIMGSLLYVGLTIGKLHLPFHYLNIP